MNQTTLHKVCAFVLYGVASTIFVGQSQAYELKLGALPPLEVHGFASQGFIKSEDYNYLGNTTDGSFQFTELGLNASINPFSRTRISVQAFAFDLGNVGNLNPFLDYASIEYTFNDYVGVRAGRVRRPGGIYNHIQDVDLARTFVLLAQGPYDSRWRDWSTTLDGAVVFGSVPLKKAGSLSYEVIGGRMKPKQDGGLSKTLQNRLLAVRAHLDSINSPLSIAGQLWWQTPVNGLRVGGFVGKISDFISRSTIAVSPVGPISIETKGDVLAQVYSLEYRVGSWIFQSEYSTYLNDAIMTQKNAYFGTIASASPSEPDSWYISAGYRFTDWLEAGTYYTEYYSDKQHRSGTSDAAQKDTALAFRFDLKDWWCVKIEGHHIKGTALLADNPSNPVRNNNGWFMFAVKTTLSF